MQFDSNTKLLSHRARGFGYAESSYSAIKAALISGIPYLELDTRVNGEGIIYCYHHSRIRIGAAIKRTRNATADDFSRKHVSHLESVLQLIKEHIQPLQKLCIDIKDFGFEQQHLELVANYELMSQTVFISWIPQTLVALHRLAPDCTLIFSHINLAFSPLLAALANGLIGRKEIGLLDFVVMGQQGISSELKHQVGFQHSVFADYLPNELVDILRSCGGGICVPKFSLSDRLDDWCRENNLQQWVFTTNEANEFHELNGRTSVNVIFTDKPHKVVGQL